MKKVFGQTVRDLKREVNKKVLKVPGIEQKVLDATSNETWGPHGTLLADIATASKNYHEYQIIMTVIWKRINDTGKNWRHVYKALIVLDYLVANGSERVIDEIREHAHQISTLADFQYIDSNGRDQGSNIRRKSQSLVMLLNDKARVAEVRQKAAANKDKYQNTSPGSGMYRPGGNGDRYDEDRYSSRDEYGYGRDREGGYRDDDRNSRNGDSYSRDGDRLSRDSEDRHGRDGYRENEYQDQQNGSRSRSVDGDHSLDDDAQHSSRGLGRKFSDQSINGPPSYEAVGESRSPQQIERQGETSSATAHKPSSPTISNDASPTNNAPSPPPAPAKQEFEGFDEFDPRVSVSVAPATMNNNAEMDLLGSLSDSFDSSPAAIMPATSTPSEAGPFAANTGYGASDIMQQPFDDPFGDAPFKALPSNYSGNPTLSSVDTAAPPFPSTNQNPVLHQQAASLPDFGYGNSLSAYDPSSSSQFPSNDISNPDEEIDILAGILPPSEPSPVTAAQTPFSGAGEHLQLGSGTSYGDFNSHGGPTTLATAQVGLHADLQFSHGNFHPTSGNSASPFSTTSSQLDGGPYGDFGSLAISSTSVNQEMSLQTQTGTELQSNHGYFQHQTGPTVSPFSAPSGQAAQSSTNISGDYGVQPGVAAPVPSLTPSHLQAGTNAEFNPENFSQQIVPSSSPFSTQSQNGQAVHLNNGNFGSQAGPAIPVTSHMSPQAPSGMNGLFNNGSIQHGAGHSASPFSSQTQSGQAMQLNNGDFSSQGGPTSPLTTMSTQAQAGLDMAFNHGNFQNQSVPSDSPYSAQSNNGQAMQPNNGAPLPQYAPAPFSSGSFVPPGGSSVGSFSHNVAPQASNGSSGSFLQQQVTGPPAAPNSQSANRHILGNMFPQSGQQQSPMNPQQPVASSVGPLAIVPQQPSKEKFQTKSTVWADTLSRGLVDLNISGPKTNPLADIGVDFDSINRKEKRMEKQPATPVVSTITMGKAMGSGTGMGRAAAGSIRPPPNPIAGNMTMGGMGMVGGHGPGMGMGVGRMGMGNGHVSGMGTGGMGMGGGPGMGMSGGMVGGMGMGMSGGMAGGMGIGMGGMGGGYGGMNQQPMGMGMNPGYNNMGMGMNPGMVQGGAPMQQPSSGGYINPMMGGSGYPQQHYGGSYR